MPQDTTTSPLLSLSEAALAFVQHDQRRDASAREVLLLGLRKRGCAGWSYTLAWVTQNEVEAAWTTWDQGELCLAVKPMDVPLLSGTHIDLVRESLGQQLVWHNPHAQESCGCGSSVNLTV